MPYVGVNHHEAHMYAALLEDPTLEPPLVTLIVSGGHTLLVAMEDHGQYRVLGQTVDDAAGEAFDKVARFLGLGYPGGPAIDRLAREGDPDAIAFPRPMLDDGDDFSFSGLKTAVVQYVRKHPEVDGRRRRRVVPGRGRRRARRPSCCGPRARTGIDTVVIGGGVAANSALRARRARRGAEAGGLRVVLPSIGLCTDNAAMVAAVAAWRLAADGPTPLEHGIDPGLRMA